MVVMMMFGVIMEVKRVVGDYCGNNGVPCVYRDEDGTGDNGDVGVGCNYCDKSSDSGGASDSGCHVKV